MLSVGLPIVLLRVPRPRPPAPPVSRAPARGARVEYGGGSEGETGRGWRVSYIERCHRHCATLVADHALVVMRCPYSTDDPSAASRAGSPRQRRLPRSGSDSGTWCSRRLTTRVRSTCRPGPEEADAVYIAFHDGGDTNVFAESVAAMLQCCRTHGPRLDPRAPVAIRAMGAGPAAAAPNSAGEIVPAFICAKRVHGLLIAVYRAEAAAASRAAAAPASRAGR